MYCLFVVSNLQEKTNTNKKKNQWGKKNKSHVYLLYVSQYDAHAEIHSVSIKLKQILYY